MIGITTQVYRGFAIHIECVRAATPRCRATIRRRFQQVHPSPGVFKGETEEDVIARFDVERHATERIHGRFALAVAAGHVLRADNRDR